MDSTVLHSTADTLTQIPPDAINHDRIESRSVLVYPSVKVRIVFIARAAATEIVDPARPESVDHGFAGSSSDNISTSCPSDSSAIQRCLVDSTVPP